MEAEPPLEERIVQVLRHLGIARAHIGARMAPDRDRPPARGGRMFSVYEIEGRSRRVRAAAEARVRPHEP